MGSDPSVTIVRLGHRPGRDERTTTHVALVARAFGAERVVIPEAASQAATTLEDVCGRFGGTVAIDTVARPLDVLKSTEVPIAHLTMYGLPVDQTVDDVRETTGGGALVVAVGAGKVPGTVYELARWNVAVTNQPHSEIAALAVFLDRLSDGAALETAFDDAEVTVVPTAADKRLEPADDA